MDWFIAPELAEASLPGMPSTARGMLKSLKKLAEFTPDKSRQRAGSKATEYHISLLPPAVRLLPPASCYSVVEFPPPTTRR